VDLIEMVDENTLNAIMKDLDRFSCVTDIEAFKKSRIPEKTQKKVDWAVRIYHDWWNVWKVRIDDGVCKVFKELKEMSVGEMDYVLQFFFSELRKKNGDQYPPRTIKEIAACVQHFLNYQMKIPLSLFKDVQFMATREAMDAAMKKSAKDGFVKEKKRAALITWDEEETMWANGTFGISSPGQLIDTLIFNLGLHLALRASQEHHDLLFGPKSQLVLTTYDAEECLKYTERTSKNKSFGIHNSRMEPKVSYIFKRPDPSRCPVMIYKAYIQHR
jgi:hypothetical protein